MITRLIVFVFVVTLYSPFAFAQMDLSGDWALLIHEDQPWRGSGPELGEYEGLPINAAARMRAASVSRAEGFSWGRTAAGWRRVLERAAGW